MSMFHYKEKKYVVCIYVYWAFFWNWYDAVCYFPFM